MANGRGTFIDAEGSTYDGEWKDGLKHGEGTEWSFPDALTTEKDKNKNLVPSWKFTGKY